MVQKISIRLGESGNDFVQRIGKKAVRVNKQPAGMNFYDVDWTIYNPGPGEITFEHGIHTFTITNALGAMGSTFEPDTHKWGIFSFDLSFGLPPRNQIPHNEARLQVISLLKMLQEKGWKQYHNRDAAESGFSDMSFSDIGMTIDVRAEGLL